MDTKLGLVVPNVKNVESKSVLEIALDLQSLQKSGQAGAFKPDDLRGGTFTLSNIGSVSVPLMLDSSVCVMEES
jgi:2-oxoisovalerate dehydrogenase E2 component (dihydrolipoyl transacylase)